MPFSCHFPFPISYFTSGSAYETNRGTEVTALPKAKRAVAEAERHGQRHGLRGGAARGPVLNPHTRVLS
jgi:hypothetical protein